MANCDNGRDEEIKVIEDEGVKYILLELYKKNKNFFIL